MKSLIEKIKRAISPRGLLLRVVIFGFGWFLLPFWLFIILALYLYLVPFFSVRRFALPFAAVVFFAAISPKSLPLAIIFSGVFYLILGVKDLVFIERGSAYKTLVLLIAFFMFVRFFSNFDSWSGSGPFLYSLIIGLLVFLLNRGFLSYGGDGGSYSAERFRRGGILAAISGLLVSQVAIAALFLPLNYLYQSALVFLVAALALELSFDYLGGKIVRRTILANLSIFLVFVVIILGSAEWTL